MRSSLLRTSALVTIALAWTTGCGDDATARYAGLSTVERSAAGVRYRLRYRNPPWKLRADDPAALDEEPREIIGGASRAVEPGSVSVLEIGSVNVAVVAGVTYPKYRLEAALVQCDELEDGENCATTLALAEVDARGAGAKLLDRTEERNPHVDVLGRNEEERRNQRVAFFETPDAMHVLWVFVDAYPELDEPEIERMLQAIDVLRDAEAP